MIEHHWSVRSCVTGRFARLVALFLALIVVTPALVAVPTTPAAAQEDTLRILLFTKQAGHNPAAPVQAVRDLATQLGAEYNQTVEFTETGDAGVFTSADIGTYDTVVFAHTGGVLFDQAQRDGFQAYIQGGGGYMGIHYAGWSRGNSEHDEWAWYHDLVGAASEGHPEIQVATVSAPDPTHPLVEDLPAEFERSDEWYDWVLNPTENVRTLLEVDEFTITQPRDPADNYDGRRNGTSHPVTWCQDFDGGRSWYTGMGHFPEHYGEPVMRDMISHGIEYTSGLLPADCSGPVNSDPGVGAWSDITPWPLVPINASLTPEGLVQSFGSVQTGNDPTPYAWDGNGPIFQGGQFQIDVWDPTTDRTVSSVNTGVLPNTTYTDLFCAIQIQDPQRDVTLTMGGDDGLGENAPNDASMGVTSYSSRDGLQTEAPMHYPRWYPTATTTPQGDIVVQGGSLYGGPGGPGALTPEIYTPDEGSGWQTLPAATSALAYGNGGAGLGPDENRWWYPRAFVAPGSGTIFNISGTQMFELDPYGNGGDGLLTDRGVLPDGIGNQGALGNPVGATSTAVMYRPGQILQAGGGWWANGGGPQGARAGFTVDITGGTENPVLQATQPMEYQRHWPTATVLPDGDVLVSGGGIDNNGAYGVATNPEIWDPETGDWTTVEVPHEHARLYHSTALLLPDGRIMVGGGGAPGPRNYTDVEFYSPAYLFDGEDLAPRPDITDAPAEIGYNGVFDIAVDSDVSRVTLVRNGSVTHGFNNDQNFQDLTYTQGPDGTVTIDAPVDATYAPPGTYMVFAFDTAGTPSVAAMLDIDPEVAMDSRTPLVVDQFEYPRIPTDWRSANPPQVITVEPGNGRMSPWTINSTVELIRAAAPSNGGLGRVGYHLALGTDGSLQRPIEGLQPGRDYRLSLRYARDSRFPDGDATATLSIGTLTDTLTAGSSQSSQSALPPTYVGTFTAQARTEVLTLAAGAGGEMILDNLVIIGVDPGLEDVGVHYEFEEGEGTTAANTGSDTSTGPATLTGTTGWTGPDGGVFGTGLDLPGGAGNVVDLPDDLLAGAEDFSVSMWANPDQLSNWTALFQIGNGTDSYFQIQSQTQTAGNTGLAATFKAPGDPAEERILDGEADPDLTSGAWNHVAFTRVGLTGTLYLNGVAVASRDDLTISLSDLGSTTDNWLGRNGFPDAPFAGLMDDVRAYTTALSADDIAALYADGSALRTTTSVTVEPASPTPFAEPLTVSATVTGSDGQPAEGSANLVIDGESQGAAVRLTDGGVTFPEVTLAPGEHDIEVRFVADAGWRDSQATVSHTVDRPDVGDGVPIHYTFDEGEGDTAANTGVDPSVGPATLLGDTGWAPGRFGSGVSLPGGGGDSQNYVDLPDDINAGLDEEFSVSIWARPDALPNWVPLLQIGSSTDTFFLLQSSTSSGDRGFGATFKQAGQPAQERLQLEGDADLPLNEWTHVVFTMSGSTGRIYFDGELVGERTDFSINMGDVGVNGGTTANYVGHTSWPDPVFDGLADDLQIYGYELTAAEVTELFQGPSGGPDTTAPTVSMALAGETNADGAYVDEVTATVTATDEPGGSGVATVEYALNDDVFVAYDGPLVVSEPGDYVLQARATDVAGNVSDVQTVTFTVVKRPPPPEGVPIHYAFDEGQGTTAANTGTDPSVGDAQLLGDTSFTPDGVYGSGVSLPGGNTDSGNFVDLPDNLMAGMDEEFTVSLWARPDVLPNWVPLFQVGSSTDTFFLLQSSTQANGPTGFAATFKAPGNPQQRLTLGAGNDLPLNEWTHVVFTMRGSTGRIYFDGQLVGERTDFPIGIGDVGVNGTTTANFIGNTSWPDPMFDGLVDDLRIYGHQLTAADVVELFQGPSDVPDTTAPQVAVELAGQTNADGAYVDEATVTVTATDEPDGSGVASIEYALDDDVFLAYVEPLVVSEPGDHVLQARATDVAGNVSDAQTLTFTVVQDDDVAPVVAVSLNPPVPNGDPVGEFQDTYNTPVQVTVDAEDPNGTLATVEYSLDGGDFQPYDGPFTVADDGEHTVVARATDEAGNTSAEESVTFTILTDACVGSDLSETVVIGTVDSGVPNYHRADGCTVEDLIEDEGSFKNHGQAVRYVRGVARDLAAQGLISDAESKAINKAASESDIGKQ